MDDPREDRLYFKFLDPSCCTHRNGKYYPYPTPAPGEKWSEWMEHPEPAEPDGEECGPGGWHVIKKLSAKYAPTVWWPWAAQVRGVLGEGSDKLRVRAVRLRRITPTLFWRCIRLGWCCRANLNGADLRDANLCGADLRSVNLFDSNLRWTNLTGANLAGANLRWASLRDANLRDANLRGADLSGADLSGADLSGADTANAIGLEG
jgi:hypothetical protein